MLHSRSRVSRARRLAAYSSVAVGSLALADNAEAVLVPFFPSPTGGNVTLRLGDSFDVDLDGDRIVDYTIDAVSHNYLGALGTLFEIEGRQVTGFQNLVSHNYDDPLLHGYAGLITPGDQVGPDVSGWHGYAPLFSTASQVGDFFGTRGWLGLYFEIPGGSPHFGYLDLEGTESSLIIHGGAFESEPDTPIEAVPEPTSLSLLALGAGGVLAWRRRRKERRDTPA